MFKFSTLLIAFLSYTQLLLAQKTNSPHTMLWEVKDPRSYNVSYLFGTMHIFGESWLDSITLVKDKFINAKHILIEGTITKDTENRIIDSFRKPYLGPAILPRKIFSNKCFNIVNCYTKSINWGDIDTLFHENPQPIVVLSLLQWLLLNDYASRFHIKTTEEDVLDHFFSKNANTKNREVTSLDNLYETVTNFIQNQNPKVLAKDIEELANSLQKSDLTLSKYYNVIKNYKNLQYNYYFTKKAPRDDESDGSELTLRNNLWMPKLINAFNKDNCFVAVGISHLNYKNGLINQLKAAGFEVTPVEIKRIGLQ